MEIDIDTQYFIGILFPAAFVVIFAFFYYKKIRNDTCTQRNEGNQQETESNRIDAVNEPANEQQHGGPRQYSQAASGGGKLPKGHNRGVNKQQRHEKGNTTAMHSHPWLVTSLKGHTTDIRDIDFSNNGKYLASCAEDGQLIGSSQNATNRHCNSNTSNNRNSNNARDLTGIDDTNSSSSNEDASSNPHINPYLKSIKKTPKSCRNQRQRKNEHHHHHQQPSITSSTGNNNGHNIATDGSGNNYGNQHRYSATNFVNNNGVMVYDDESKENQHPFIPRSSSVGSKMATGARKATVVRSVSMRKSKETSTAGNITIVNSSSKKHSKHSLKHHVKNSTFVAATTCNGANNKHSTSSSISTVLMNASVTSSSKISRKEILINNSKALLPPLKQHAVLNLDESDLLNYLQYYVVSPHLLRIYGYPVESPFNKGCVEIFKCSIKSSFEVNRPLMDINKIEHTTAENATKSYPPVLPPVPELQQPSYAKWNSNLRHDSNQYSGDSGQGSESSSAPSIDSDTSDGNEDDALTADQKNPLERVCSRCKQCFLVTNDGEYLTKDECVYHWGKVFQAYDREYGMCNQYSCCNGGFANEGCTRHPLHVWSGVSFGPNGPYTDFVSTEQRRLKSSLSNRFINKKRYIKNRNAKNVKDGLLLMDIDDEDSCDSDSLSSTSTSSSSSSSLSSSPSNSSPIENQYKNNKAANTIKAGKVFALDCEMCFTVYGLELAKVTVVGSDGQLVYETFVRPKGEIVDYNTRFSGITEMDLSPNNNNVKTLQQVQRDLLKLINADTILIGHALENDLRVLKIVHKKVIDTSITFPHHSGFPYRRALKTLTKFFLNRDIQNCESGHSSLEDSRACLELILWKVYKDFHSDFEQRGECTNENN